MEKTNQIGLRSITDESQTLDAVAPGKGRNQKYLGELGLITLITLLSAFVPLSTDLYLPALPGMAKYFDVSADLTKPNLDSVLCLFQRRNAFLGTAQR